MGASAQADEDRRARATRLAPYFELQLVVAAAVAARAGIAVGAAVTTCTNLHRRFGYGDVGDDPSPAWREFLVVVEAATRLDERVRCAVDAFAAGQVERMPADREFFGCFAFDPPDPDGNVRIHFFNRDSDDGMSPLAPDKIARRRSELRALSGRIRDAHPTARTVVGGSWLYHLEAYRRLFPPAYVAGRAPAEPVRLTGTSSWGQVLDHQERVKPPVRDAILVNLEALDPSAPWRVFPLRPLRTTAPVDVFFDFYGV